MSTASERVQWSLVSIERGGWFPIRMFLIVPFHPKKAERIARDFFSLKHKPQT